jgi:hypothetical protein
VGAEFISDYTVNHDYWCCEMSKPFCHQSIKWGLIYFGSVVPIFYSFLSPPAMENNKKSLTLRGAGTCMSMNSKNNSLVDAGGHFFFVSDK